MNPEARSNPTPTGSLPVNAIIEELQRHARICEVASQDLTEAALTGEISDKEKNMQQAGEWLLKSAVWLEAEAAVRGLGEAPAQLQTNPALALPHTTRIAAPSPAGG